MGTRYVLLIAVAAACGGEPEPAAEPIVLDAALNDSAGIQSITLSHAPAHWVTAGAPINGELLEHAHGLELGAVVDLAVLADGTVALLDALMHQIVLLEPEGGTTRMSREGAGPGELGVPLALDALDSVFDTDARLVATSREPVPGDWARVTTRSPFLQIDGEQRGSEDVTRRIAPLGDSAFLFVLEQNDHATYSDAAAPARSAWILLIDTALAVRDTVAVLPGTPTFPRTVGALAGFPLFEQPLYSSRPVVASGPGWYAIGHGEMSHVEIRNSTGALIARVQWPDARPAIGAGERREGAEWELALRIINSSRAAEL